MHLNLQKRVLNLEIPAGHGRVSFEWQAHDGTLFAVTGSNQNLSIYDHYGNKKILINLPGICTGFGWDFEGSNLGAIAENSSVLTIWNSKNSKVLKVETGLKEQLTFLAWGKTGVFLAIGTMKGNVLLYNQKAGRKVPILGKHSKKITCGAWSSDNLLALGSEDRTLSVSTFEGDTVYSSNLRSEPSQIQFSEMKLDERSTAETTVSVIVGSRSLVLFNINDADNPIELAFQHVYGNITTYRWFGDGYIMIGFTAGICIAISTHLKEIGQELFQINNHKDQISSISISPALNQVACSGDNNVKIYDLADMEKRQEICSTITVENDSDVESCSWSHDGRFIAVTTTSGNVYIYLTRLNILASASQLSGNIAVLTSIKEVTVYDSEMNSRYTIQCELEPVFLLCGPKSIALGMNNHSWLYSSLDGQLLRKLQFVASVQSISLNETHMAALVDGRVYLQHVEEQSLADDSGNDSNTGDFGVFPVRESVSAKITSHTLTKEHLIYATDAGDIVYYSLSDAKPVSEYRHACGWKYIYNDVTGTLLVAVDIKNHGYLYSPVKEILLQVPDFPIHHRGVLWDSTSLTSNIFVAWSQKEVDVFVYNAQSLAGNHVTRVCSFSIPTGQTPLLLQGPELMLLSSSSKLTTFFVNQLGIASTSKLKNSSRQQLIDELKFALMAGRYRDAWEIGIILDDTQEWIQAATFALQTFNIDFAIRIYQHLGQISMVWSLEEIKGVENLHLLSGHIYMILGNLEKAQEYYLKSARPEIAIDMHTDVMQWEQALNLAKQFAPQKMAWITREYAQQLEQTGDYVNGLMYYDRALNSGADQDRHHIDICQSGIARCAIGSGDIHKGISICKKSADDALMKQCAMLLEANKYYLEAAELFECSGNKDQAAVLFARLKNWNQVSRLIHDVTQPKVHIAYAKAKESQGQYKEALMSYELAGDFESAILLCLNHLHSPQDAVRIARRSKSTEGAVLIGKYFMEMGDHTAALEYLVLSKNYDTAFEVARKNGEVQLFADILGDQAQQEDYNKIGLYYENERKYLLSGKYFALAGHHTKAFNYFIKAAQKGADEEKAINAAIHVVSTSKDDQLAAQLIAFLSGEQDNIPKDGKYLFRFYLARKQFKEAAKTALIIATEEQNAGNYRDAHTLLQHMYQEFNAHGITVPLEIERNLELLHSYVIVRMHIRNGRHLNAARLLIRVAQSISKFPAHVVPILTSVVIECDRAGLKNAAYQHAVTLMKPENRNLLDDKYRKKIESIVRRPPKGFTDAEEDLTPCPFCQAPILSTLLTCVQCQQPIPICIVTGLHIVKADLTRCPSCRFMATRSELIKLVKAGELCPMCSHKISDENALIPWNDIVEPRLL